MTSKIRSLGNFRNPIVCLILLAAFAAAAGCSTAESPGGSSNNMNHILPSGSSVAGWLVTPSGGTHTGSATKDYIANTGSSGCSQCHGSDLTGGISGVSCFGNPAGCHHGPVANWTTPAVHGATAKKAPGSSGFASCQICHAANFSGGGAQVPCSRCHIVNAPHPRAPWHSSTGSTHSDTNTLNAPVCAQCHYLNSPNNPANHPSAPAPAGTAPGCFNNTLCHGAAAAPHALGATWTDPTSSQFHGLTAKQNLSYCQGCHGTPGTTLFNGGAAPTSCQASCHAQAKAHPIRWYQAPQPFPAYVPSHRDSGNISVACAICHKVDGAGTGPDPNAPSCFSASFNGVTCHSGGPGGPNHLVPFPGAPHTTTNQAVYDSDCANCHSITGVPPNSSAPTCTVCHQAGSPLSALNCTSCHARPPDNPSTTAYPNVRGAHGKHDNLAGVTGVCTVCHTGLDTGSSGHYDRANARPGKNALRVLPGDVTFVPTTYNAKAGAASFSSTALTCANVSCHGAVAAPNWQSGSINVSLDAGCRACHKIGTAAQTPENNSPFSGLHTFHLNTTVGGAILCTECHNMANGTTGALNHFKFLNTAQMEGPASNTVAPNGSAANYNATTQSCGTFTCHTVTHSALPWSGAATHLVPFTGPNHTTVTSGTFPANCGGCHFETGTAIKLGPPCTVCHQAGSPLTNGSCTSCHATPPNSLAPAGAAYPNLAGAHVRHLALATIPGGANVVTCDTCHTGLGFGTPAHYDRANARTGTLRVEPGDVAFIAPFPYTTGTPTFNNSLAALTCGSVSCHGGRATPNWQTSNQGVNNLCTSCHESGTTPYNAYNSGAHGDHINIFGISADTCRLCHNTTTLAVNHFNTLSTKVMEGPASATIGGGATSVALYTAGGTPGTGSCTPVSGVGCHEPRTW